MPASQDEDLCAGKEPDSIGGEKVVYPAGIRLFKFGTPLQGLIFSKSRVHGYGRLGDAFRDHRESEP